jgi:hypothetical protein
MQDDGFSRRSNRLNGAQRLNGLNRLNLKLEGAEDFRVEEFKPQRTQRGGAPTKNVL